MTYDNIYYFIGNNDNFHLSDWRKNPLYAIYTIYLHFDQEIAVPPSSMLKEFCHREFCSPP